VAVAALGALALASVVVALVLSLAAAPPGGALSGRNGSWILLIALTKKIRISPVRERTCLRTS
jgi:hypothetical protein